MHIAVNEAMKNSALISNPEEVIYVEDRRKKAVKSIIIPARFAALFEKQLAEVEYQLWLERNKKAFGKKSAEEFAQIESAEDVGERL